MKKTLKIIFLIAFLAAGTARADEFGDIRLRPSYQQTFKSCEANKKKFKIKMYENAFVSGLQDFIQLATLSPQGVSSAISNRGLASFVVQFLSLDTTWPALTACMPLEGEQKEFVRTLHLSDGFGKAAGLVIVVASGKMLVGLTQGAYSALASISPLLAKNAMIATSLAGSAYSFYSIQKELKVQRQTEAQKQDVNLTKDYSDRMTKAAVDNIQKLQELLKDPALSASQKASTEREIANWTQLLQNFKT